MEMPFAAGPQPIASKQTCAWTPELDPVTERHRQRQQLNERTCKQVNMAMKMNMGLKRNETRWNEMA